MPTYVEHITTFIDRQRFNYEYEPQEGGIVPEGTLDIVENGVYDVRKYAYANVNVEGGSPIPSEPPVKGDIIALGTKSFLVLEANGWECKLMFNGIASSVFYQSEESIEHVEFLPAGGQEGNSYVGIKYEGSDLDVYCNETFLASLSEDVQNAIIEEEVVQNIFDNRATEGTEDYLIDGGELGRTSRIKKTDTDPVVVGNRKIHSLMVDELFDYLGTTTTISAVNEMVFGVSNGVYVGAWTGSAKTSTIQTSAENDALIILGEEGAVTSQKGYFNCIVRPVFRINLEGISWSK